MHGDRSDCPRILLAEGSASLRCAIATTLRADGWEVLEAPDGFELLARLESRPASGALVIVAAVRLDGLTGMDVLAALRCLSWGVPVVLLAEPGDAEADAEGRELGAAAVLHLPLDIEQLRAAVSRAALPSRMAYASRRSMVG